MKFYVTGDLQVSQHISEWSILSLMLTCDLFLQEAHFFALKNGILFMGDCELSILGKDFCKLRFEYSKWEFSEDNLKYILLIYLNLHGLGGLFGGGISIYFHLEHLLIIVDIIKVCKFN